MFLIRLFFWNSRHQKLILECQLGAELRNKLTYFLYAVLYLVEALSETRHKPPKESKQSFCGNSCKQSLHTHVSDLGFASRQTRVSKSCNAEFLQNFGRPFAFKNTKRFCLAVCYWHYSLTVSSILFHSITTASFRCCNEMKKILKSFSFIFMSQYQGFFEAF